MSQSDGADEEICTPKPSVRNFTRPRWGPGENVNEAEFHTIDGFGSIVTRWGWGWDGNGERKVLNHDIGKAMTDVQRILIAGGDDPQDRYGVEIGRNAPRGYRRPGIAQIPFHQDMLPSYEYFATNLRESNCVFESFKIRNTHLPLSPYFSEKLVPALEASETLYTLELSNCLGQDDLKSVVAFLAKNQVLHKLNLTNHSFDEETAISLANAIRKHPVLYDINLDSCSLGNGDTEVLNKILYACKDVDSLSLGHSSFTSDNVALLARFIGKKIALTSLSLNHVSVGKDSQKLVSVPDYACHAKQTNNTITEYIQLAHGLGKNKNIEELSLPNCGLQLPKGVLNNNNLESLCRLTSLDLSNNSLPATGAKGIADLLSISASRLSSLNLASNRLTSASAKIIFPALKENSTLLHLDVSNNSLGEPAVGTIIDMLKQNSTLRTLDIMRNNSLKFQSGGRYDYSSYYATGSWSTLTRKPAVPRGKMDIERKALFDTTSLQSIASSNHTCDVKMSNINVGDSQAKTIGKINSLENQGLKVRLKVVLAINSTNKELCNASSFGDVPLELFPMLLELVQQRLVGDTTLKCTLDKTSLRRIFDLLTGFNLQLLFERGSGLREVKVTSLLPAKKKKPKKKRRKFGDEDDPDDGTFAAPAGCGGGGAYARLVYDAELGRTTWKMPSPAKPTRKSARKTN